MDFPAQPITLNANRDEYQVYMKKNHWTKSKMNMSTDHMPLIEAAKIVS